jgi:hypothetical protein
MVTKATKDRNGSMRLFSGGEETETEYTWPRDEYEAHHGHLAPVVLMLG